MSAPAHNTTAHMLGTGEFSFCEGSGLTAATAAAKGYVDFGNVKVFAVMPESEMKEHIGAYRGTLRRDRIDKRVLKLAYRLTCDEWDLRKLLFLFYGEEATAFTQSALAADDGQALDFSSTSSVAGRWYDLFDTNGKRVRKLTAVTIATLTEGTDFEVDLVLGRIKFLTEQSASLTPVLTAEEITASDAGYMEALTPLQLGQRRGFGRIVCFDENADEGVVFDHHDFGCDVSVEGQPNVDGQEYSTFDIMVTVTDPVGTLWNRG